MTIIAKRSVLVGLVMLGILGRGNIALAQFNPYAMQKFNPANPIVSPTTVTNAVNPSVVAPYDPYYAMPYNPYYGPGPVGGALMGVADVYRAYGTVIMNQEQARSLREQANQAKLDTKRKRFELDMFIKANTPTFTEDQARIARSTLKRIQGNSTPAEIASGKALNLMLEDARKFASRKVTLQPTALSEDVLGQLNVTASYYGLGLLRDDDKINWPFGLKEVLSADQLKTLEAQAQVLVKAAYQGKLDSNTFRDFGGELDRAQERLVQRADDLVGPQYLEAKRFLSDLKDARFALEKGEAQRQSQYQKFIVGGKSVHDVVEFMINRGLRFAPASAQDEAAYRAFYSALVAFDVALNAEGATAAAGTK